MNYIVKKKFIFSHHFEEPMIVDKVFHLLYGYMHLLQRVNMHRQMSLVHNTVKNNMHIRQSLTHYGHDILEMVASAKVEIAMIDKSFSLGKTK